MARFRLTVLCENSVAGPFGLIGEHGWAAFIETAEGTVLFDTGQGQGIVNNSRVLGCDIASADCLVLSHGHYDHTGGLPDVLAISGGMTVHAHPDIFVDRWWQRGEVSRHIGLRYRRAYLESLGAEFRLERGFRQILPGIFVTGEVPRVTDFEPPDPNMKVQDEEGRWVQDELLDDLSLIVDTPEGLVVVLGCAHAGLINILSLVREKFSDRPIHTVVGGTHLGFAGQEQFQRTLDHLDAFGVKRLGASHCTGLVNSSKLYCALKEGFFHAAVGTVVEI